MKGKAAFLSEYTELYGTGEVRTEGEPSQIDTCCVESYFCATSCTAALLFFLSTPSLSSAKFFNSKLHTDRFSHGKKLLRRTVWLKPGTSGQGHGWRFFFCIKATVHNAVRSVPCQPDHLQTSSDHKRIPAVRVQTKVYCAPLRTSPGDLGPFFPIEASALPSTNITLSLRATAAEWPNLSRQHGQLQRVLTTHKCLFSGPFFFFFLESVSVLEA